MCRITLGTLLIIVCEYKPNKMKLSTDLWATFLFIVFESDQFELVLNFVNCRRGNLLPNNQEFKRPLERSLLKTLREKGENAVNQHFLLFPTMFSIQSQTNHSI